MAGVNSSFSAKKFREGIKFAMNMGLPQDASERVTFYWKDVKTYVSRDPGGDPYDWGATPVTSVVKSPVLVSAAVKFSEDATTRPQSMGQFDITTAVITLLDEEYALVSDADYVVIGGNRYTIDFWAPPVGIFEVTVYTCYCRAVDES